MKQEDKNFWLGVINGAFFILAGTFISGNIVMPLFLKNFTSSKMVIGLASAVLATGWYLPQFFEGYFSESKPNKMPIYKFASSIRALSFALIILAIIVFADSRTTFAITVIILLLLFYGLSGGVSGLIFMDIVAKTIPAKKRGYYFGGRYFFGGLLALGGSLIVSYVLGNKETFLFPWNYVILFSLAFVLILSAFSVFMKVKEPPGIILKKRSFTAYTNEAVDCLKSDKNYRGLMLTRYLCGATSIAAPFYVLYGIESLKFPQSIVGSFLLAQVIGGIISNLFWGYLGETKGSKIILQVYAVLSITAPLLAILSSYYEVWKFLYLFTFLFIGFADAGGSVGFFNFLLDISPAEKRASYIGFMHSFTAPVLLIPTLGGFLMDKITGVTYIFVFVLALLFGIFGLLTTFRLVEPRLSR